MKNAKTIRIYQAGYETGSLDFDRHGPSVARDIPQPSDSADWTRGYLTAVGDREHDAAVDANQAAYDAAIAYLRQAALDDFEKGL